MANPESLLGRIETARLNEPRPQTPDQHPLPDINNGAKRLIDRYVKTFHLEDAAEAKIRHLDGSRSSYSRHTDGTRQLVRNALDFTLIARERFLIDGNITPAEVIYSDSKENLKDSEEAESLGHQKIKSFANYPRKSKASVQ